MKAALITDTHWGIRNDSIVYHNYFDKFYTNVFFPYLKEHDIKTIFHLGDIVDRRKYINYVTLNAFKNIFIQPCIENDIDLHVIVGNHDIPYRNTNEVNAMKELFNHCYLYDMEPKDIEFDGMTIAMLPWINNSNYDDMMKFIAESKSQVLFGHLELEGFQMYAGQIQSSGMDTKPFEKFDLVCSGHYHHRSTKGNISYLRSPYELTWNDYNDSRGFHIFDSETREIEFIPNPYKMFYKVWYDDTDKTLEDYTSMDFSDYAETSVKVIVKNKNNPYWFDIMMDKLYNSNPINVSIVEDNKHMDLISEEEIISEAEDTLTTLNNYVNNMETKVDKRKLQTLFAELYTEAQNMEL